MNDDFHLNKTLLSAQDLVSKLNLDLKGLTVATECASKAYGFLPILARLAGAEVLAVGKNSRYGLYAENKSTIEQILESIDLNNNIHFFENKIPSEYLNRANIITNSGFLRPIDKAKIDVLNKNAVVCLMWETWEFRNKEIDILACQAANIPVIGTKEFSPFQGYEIDKIPKKNDYGQYVDMSLYPGMIAMKLLFEIQQEIAYNNIVLIGGGLIGQLIAETFQRMGITFTWFTKNGTEKHNEIYPYSNLIDLLSEPKIDVLLCVDHVTDEEIIGNNGYINFNDIATRFPYIKYAHLCGNIDFENLKNSEIFYYPRNILPKGYMSYDSIDLGWTPVIRLLAGGLKVGEIAAKERLAGKTIKETIQKTIDYGIGQDFKGGFSEFRP